MKSKRRFGFQYRCKCATCGNSYVTDQVIREAVVEKTGKVFRSREDVTTSTGCYMCGSKKVSKVEQVG